MKYGLSLAFAALWLIASQAPVDAQNFEKGLTAARAGDFGVALAEWRPLAESGHVEAQFNLGAIYEAGLGVSKDPEEAAGWYAQAAGKGHAKAQYNLGVMYAEGRGVPRDDARAATWMRKAAEQDHGKAQYNLGILYQTGRGLPKDPVQARTWLDRAAANGVALTRAGGQDPAPEAKPRSVESPLKPEPQPGPASPNVASLPAGSLHIAVTFPQGARYRLEVTETRERVRDGGLVMAQSSEMGVDMVVNPGPSDGSLIVWTYGPATIETAGDPRAGRLASEIGKLIDGQIVEYRTSRSGEVTGIGNPDQLSSFYEKAIERVLASITAQADDPQVVDIIRANLAPLMSGDYAAARALDLPKLMHFFSGLELAAGQTYSRDSVMSLPPSADALPSTLEYELKWFDRAAGVAWLNWRQSVDPQRAAGAIRVYIETLAAQAGRSLPEGFDIGAINVSDSADYEIDLATGFPKQVIYTRKIALFDFTQTEKRRVRVLR